MSTFASLHYHFVFSTKLRAPAIADSWKNRLHAYIAGTTKNLGGKAVTVGGINDHVHILVDLPTDQRISDFMRDLKSAATRWVHEEIGNKGFSWQEGYAVFAVSANHCGYVRNYILKQAEHHTERGFREELVHLLESSNVQFDPRYLD